MLALFGFFTCVALDAPWWAYLIGFLCLILDGEFGELNAR